MSGERWKQALGDALVAAHACATEDDEQAAGARQAYDDAQAWAHAEWAEARRCACCGVDEAEDGRTICVQCVEHECLIGYRCERPLDEDGAP